MRRLIVLTLLLAACGGSEPVDPSAPTTTLGTPAPSNDHVIIDDSQYGTGGIDGQWISTTDPDGTEYLCFVVGDYSRDNYGGAGGIGLGLGVSCHERGPR